MTKTSAPVAPVAFPALYASPDEARKAIVSALDGMITGKHKEQASSFTLVAALLQLANDNERARFIVHASRTSKQIKAMTDGEKIEEKNFVDDWFRDLSPRVVRATAEIERIKIQLKGKSGEQASILKSERDNHVKAVAAAKNMFETAVDVAAFFFAVSKQGWTAEGNEIKLVKDRMLIRGPVPKDGDVKAFGGMSLHLNVTAWRRYAVKLFRPAGISGKSGAEERTKEQENTLKMSSVPLADVLSYTMNTIEKKADALEAGTPKADFAEPERYNMVALFRSLERAFGGIDKLLRAADEVDAKDEAEAKASRVEREPVAPPKPKGTANGKAKAQPKAA